MPNKEMEGQEAPGFELKDQDGNTVKLSDFKGQTFVLYFYPKDDTPGCTKEACNFRDNWAAFKEANVPVLGVSPDSPESHQRFIEKYDLPFTLLADEDHQVAEAYDAWKEKNMYGKRFWGIARSTFIIGPDQKIAKVYGKVSPETHGEQVLEDLKALQTAA